MKRVTIVAAPLAAAAALTAFGVFGAHGAGPQTGQLIVKGGLVRPPVAFVRANALYDRKGNKAELGGSVSGALMGPLSPVAVASPDGRLTAYNTWRELRQVDAENSFSRQGVAAGEALGTPSLRIHDEAGRDFLLEGGAYSVAWRGDGAIAFVRGTEADFRAGRTYDGDVVVRAGVRGRDVTWTTEPGRYVVYRWAGERLLFYRVGLGERLELLVADAPGKIRPLADGSAIAASPDGSRVLTLSQDGRNVRLLEVASGRELAWLDVTTATPSLAWVAYSGSWVGEHVVAAASAGLAVFRVTAGAIQLEQVLSLDRAQFPVGVQEPRFIDEAANEIAATADMPPDHGRGGISRVLRCDRIARTCELSDSAPATDWLRLVDEGGL